MEAWDQSAVETHSNQVWAQLQRGVSDRRSLWHTPTIATVDERGGPELRTVVLRGASSVDWTLRFHTDRRSNKFAQLHAAPLIALHVYDPKQKLQIRISGRASLHWDDDLANKAWDATQPMSRLAYAQVPRPGEKLTTADIARVTGGHHDQEARANFAAVVIHAATIDWLSLAAGGHRRALLERAAFGQFSGHWLAP